MKFLLTILSQLLSKEQEGVNVDPKVLAQFEIVYPNIETVLWHVEKNYWIAFFQLNGKAHAAYFDNKGLLVKSKHQVGDYMLDSNP